MYSWVLVVKNPPANVGDMRYAGSIPGSGRFPGEGHGSSLQYSCLENPWTEEPGGLHAIGVAESLTWLKQLSIHTELGEFQSSSVQLCLTLCDPMDCSTPGFPVHHQLPELAQTHSHWISDAIQPSHPLSSPSPPAFNLSQHKGLFQWVSSSQQMAKVLELQQQSFHWIFRIDFL